ncbi:MAG: hypothetical protein KJO88_00215 [Gammaproteobacteria bacterium]|nr:hypothetical protein [Gammaproteobacteria bacterium]NNM13819.1 hypothetical protein [Gammaproteobacteria bacterium]
MIPHECFFSALLLLVKASSKAMFSTLPAAERTIRVRFAAGLHPECPSDSSCIYSSKLDGGCSQ